MLNNWVPPLHVTCPVDGTADVCPVFDVVYIRPSSASNVTSAIDLPLQNKLQWMYLLHPRDIAKVFQFPLLFNDSQEFTVNFCSFWYSLSVTTHSPVEQVVLWRQLSVSMSRY